MEKFLVYIHNSEVTMKCQIPGCKCKKAKPISKSGIFYGVNLENITIYSCGNHTKLEVDRALEIAGEKEVFLLQDENPFCKLEKSRNF